MIANRLALNDCVMIYGHMEHIETFGTSQRATTNDIQIAFSECSRMTPDTITFSRFVMRYDENIHAKDRSISVCHYKRCTDCVLQKQSYDTRAHVVNVL